MLLRSSLARLASHRNLLGLVLLRIFREKTHSAELLPALAGRFFGLLRKEVIQPLVLERLPCYDFTPVIGFALGSRFISQLWAPPTSMV